MESRPKIKINPSRFDKRIELSCNIFLLILWALALYTFFKSAVTIPVHFNASGQVDKYGNKATIFILPILSTVIYFVLTQLSKYPYLFNYMTKITEDNAQLQYTNAVRTLRFLKLAVLMVFTATILFTYLTTIVVCNGLGVCFLPLSIGLLLIPTIILIVKLFKKQGNVA